jgi:SAM-dependent methyltransferase
MAPGSNAEIWQHDVADAWVRHAERYDTTLEPFGHAVIDALELRPGDRVLDVGCGTGATTVDLAARVSPGQVVGVDVSASMLAAARRREGAGSVRFVEADAGTADLDGFDVVFSRFGVMFFDDPPAAFANLARALVPGGRLGFVCFQGPPANPFIVVPVLAGMGALGLGLPAEPGPFSLADPDELAGLLAAAGLVDVRIDAGPDEAVLHGAEDLPELAARLLEQNPITSGPLAAADDAARAAAIRATADALEPHRRGDEVRLGAGAWVVRATRPG